MMEDNEKCNPIGAGIGLGCFTALPLCHLNRFLPRLGVEREARRSLWPPIPMLFFGW